MAARIIDGKLIADRIGKQLGEQIAEFSKTGRRPPSLKVLLVGQDGASLAYVGAKKRTLGKAGMLVDILRFDASVSQNELTETVARLNEDTNTDAIIVQMPLPKQINSDSILDMVTPTKDVDGLHPTNAGLLVTGKPGFRPATPLGVVRLLKESQIPTVGRTAVVIGRSRLVGMPLAMMLAGFKYNATVTIIHRHCDDIGAHTRNADIVISATGKPNLLRPEMVKPGSTVVDVGITRVADKHQKRGYRLVGDVDFDGVSQVAGAITPVPGGVGPMTVVMLMQNVLRAAHQRNLI